MKKQRFHYTISGYRWAPESVRVGKGLTGQPPKNLQLTAEERSNIGLLVLTKGFDAAVGYVKHIERAKERQRRKMITYGFYAKGSASQMVYCPQLTCRSDASLKERLCIFRMIRNDLREKGGRITTSTQCELDGNFRPKNVKENTITVDFCRPLCISMGYQIIPELTERPYHPWQKAPKESR